MDISSHSNNILLSGFMGCGKSSVGREVAKRLDRFFLDTDLLIESLEHKSIKNIFEEHGEAYFRSIEKRLANWLQYSVKNALIATGGGFVIYNENIKDLGTVFYLDASLDTINSRINEHERDLRPLFKEQEMIKRLYHTRTPIYKSRAHHTIDANRGVSEIAEEIIAYSKLP